MRLIRCLRTRLSCPHNAISPRTPSSLCQKTAASRALTSPVKRYVSSQAREELQAKYARFFEHKPVPRLTPTAVLAHNSPSPPDTPLAIHGFLGKPAKGGDASLTLFAMTTVEGYEVQLASTSAATLQAMRAIPPFSPVRVAGAVRAKPSFAAVNTVSGGEGGDSTAAAAATCFAGRWSLQVSEIHPLNAFPPNIIISENVRFPPTARHLQLRFQRDAAARLHFRSSLRHSLARAAHARAYADIETPLLFKATPEGAREFLVPVRGRPGFAYALPQSPQQYKQVLMAAGVERYVQFARCFRDEDLRADRQPEFTQMDLERAFADGEQVMQDVEGMVVDAWRDMAETFGVAVKDGSWSPVSKKLSRKNVLPPPPVAPGFPRMTYADCIALYGTDKPDLRIPHPIFRFPSNAPIQEFLSKTTSLPDPVMEACVIRLDGSTLPRDVRAKVASFMNALDDAYARNPHGAPQALVYNSSQPLNGLSSLGHEGADALAAAPAETGMADLRDGDVLLFQARDPTAHIDGSTRLGELRPRLWNHLSAYIPAPPYPELKFLWVTDFPLFSPAPDGDNGLVSTHHPFTAPLAQRDFDLLFSDPAAATAEHYDLVLNGVEVGGGSRRIHVAEVQEFVMRDILALSDERMKQFAHLLQALRDGCPPHAGFALGFDRLCAVLSGTASVKNVIAFPKSHKGEDLFVKAPARVESEHWRMYNLAPVKGGVMS